MAYDVVDFIKLSLDLSLFGAAVVLTHHLWRQGWHGRMRGLGIMTFIFVWAYFHVRHI